MKTPAPVAPWWANMLSAAIGFTFAEAPALKILFALAFGVALWITALRIADQFR